MIIERNDKTNFNLKKFEKDFIGSRSTLPWRTWEDVGQFYGKSPVVMRLYVRDMEQGVLRESLYKELCGTLGKELVDRYFGNYEAPIRKPLSAEEREIEELADLIVYGRIK